MHVEIKIEIMMSTESKEHWIILFRILIHFTVVIVITLKMLPKQPYATVFLYPEKMVKESRK